MAPANPWDPLRAWLARCGEAFEAIEPLAGDVSARRYARIRFASGGTAIAAQYPPPDALGVDGTLARYRATTRLLAAVSVRVPEILAEAPEEGLMLVEDLGPATLFEHAAQVSRARLEDWFRAAMAVLARVQAIPPAAVRAVNPPLDSALLRRELEQTWVAFLDPWQLAGSTRERRLLHAALAHLCGVLGTGPQVVCHRDFMVRNLIPMAGELGVLDHQDLRLGPRAYDLASLLNDSLFPDPALEIALLDEMCDGGPDAPSLEEYHRAAAQRTLKALGTFARAGAAGSARHQALIAPTLERALGCLARVPETAPLVGALARRWLCQRSAR